MKKVGYILLLLILILQSGAMLLFFKAQQCYVQYEMIGKLNNRQTEFETLTLTNLEYKKSRIESDEIYWQGKLFDIKTTSFSDDSVQLVVINDIGEEDILKKIKKLIKSSASSESRLPDQLYKLITLIYLPINSVNLYSPDTYFINTFHFFCQNIFSRDLDKTTPPPKLV